MGRTCAASSTAQRGSAGDSSGVYFRVLMVGYLEGISSERDIAWRCRDSFSVRAFLGYELAKNPPARARAASSGCGSWRRRRGSRRRRARSWRKLGRKRLDALGRPVGLRVRGLASVCFCHRFALIHG